jgi:hypothetical protein
MNSKATPNPSGREAALARRRALSSKGKQAAVGNTQERTRGAAVQKRAPVTSPPAPSATTPKPATTSAPASARAYTPARATARRAAPVLSPSLQSRSQARARREALSKAGRRAEKSKDRVRTADGNKKSNTPQPSAPASATGCSCGCKGNGQGREPTVSATAGRTAVDLTRPGRQRKSNGSNGGSARMRRLSATAKSTGRLLALARRSAQSSRGKAAGDTPTSAAGLARQANPKLSGRELAQRVREQRSKNGSAGERKSQSSGRIRAERKHGAASDQPWKVGVSETARGQLVTGTRVARSVKTTGDEPSTCRTITGTEYMGAEIFREFCQTEPPRGPAKVGASSTSHANRVTGTEVGRSPRVTGDEPGTCKSVTGTEYLASEQQESFCNLSAQPGPRKVDQGRTASDQRVSGTLLGRSPKVTGDEQGAAVRPTGTQYTDAQSIKNGRVETGKARPPAPPKVGTSVTLSGRTVTGTRVGRSGKVTGDEPGSCRIVTGDEYADLGQYQSFCGISPPAEPPKIGQSTTPKHQRVSGTQTGRSAKVTGDEPGTCKAVTGTPYAGLEQAADYCDESAQGSISARTRQLASTPGPRMTGIQPGIDGGMTGASKGACETVTGTPYVGQDQYASACGGNGAQPGDSDFPRPLDEGTEGAPWQHFSVLSPARQAFDDARMRRAVTGTRYETGNQITGPFDMGVGKITGTEQFRFDTKRVPRQDLTVMSPPDQTAEEQPAEQVPERVRITGEGQSAGPKITGDDWDRGDRVTGTEGASAKRRNPTRPGPMSAMPPVERKRNEEVPEPLSRVTGSSGNTPRGALVTYSGGARG